MKNFLIGLSIGVLLLFYFLNTKQEEAKSSSLNEENKFDYLSIKDNTPILNDKFDHYILPNKEPKEEISEELKEFLVKDYYSKREFGLDYSDSCLKSKKICAVESSEFQLVSVDLDEDGKDEYIVMPWKVCDCSMRGASGNGDILIVKEITNKFEIIGEIAANGYIISKKKTNGYFDILTNFHSSAATGTETLYKFQRISNGNTTYNKYEPLFTKWYDFTKVSKKD